VVVDFAVEEDPLDPAEPVAVAESPDDELLPPPPQAATAATTKTRVARKGICLRSDLMADLKG
jgi:hypothetical protein